MDNLRYPIGRFEVPDPISAGDLETWIANIGGLPQELRITLAEVTDAELEQTYRPGGWTVRQLVHHLPDSHLNAYLRFKWSLTEDKPHIKAYDEKAWAETPEVAAVPIAVSLDLLTGLHDRWLSLLRHLEPADFSERGYQHSDGNFYSLAHATGLYAWHGRHHLAHARLALKR